MLHWSAAYIGLPWRDLGRDRAGIDCWGLARLPFLELHGIELPSYTDVWNSPRDREEIAAVIANDRSAWPWRPVEPGCERELDVAVFRRAGLETHVGVVVARGQMLHAVDGSESRIEPFDRGRWKAKLAGIYRHAQIAHAA
jgi:cell wall-associated NlpC family hydrolase